MFLRDRLKLQLDDDELLALEAKLGPPDQLKSTL
jgi:hypothetical protein